MSETQLREWFSAGELAALALPGFPATKPGVLKRFTDEGRNDPRREGFWWRRRNASGGGLEYSVHLLPDEPRVALLTQLRTAAESARKAPDAREALARDVAWAAYLRASDTERARAARRLLAVRLVTDRMLSGWSAQVAMQTVASEHDVSLSALYEWRSRVALIPADDQVTHLLDAPSPGRPEADCTPEAWEMFKADYLRPEKPSYATCYRRLQRVAAGKGWAVPSQKTLQRRVEAMPYEVRLTLRQGAKALKAAYPAQERDRSVFHALQAVCADGHKLDLFCRWPDGTVARPELLGFQDLYSGMILSWRVERSENAEAVRLCIGDMVEQWGIPEHCYLDNGRAFASHWISGGARTRFRFKQQPIDGVLKVLGIEPHFVTPYSGQSKPIERAWRDFADNISRDPRLAGAYTGNTPAAKPENYGSRAIPLDVLLPVIADGVAEHNARRGRDTRVCGKRLSFREAFEASYATSLIRKGTAAQRQYWLLAAEAVTVRKPAGSVHLLDNRYWAEPLLQHIGQRVVVRFDPQLLHQPLAVYTMDGRFLCEAPCVEAVGFNNVDAAREISRKRREWMRAVRTQAEHESSLGIEKVAQFMRENGQVVPPPAEPRIIRMVTDSGAVREIEEADAEEQQQRFLIGSRRYREARENPLRLVESSDE